MIVNSFEEKPIKNSKLPEEWKNQEDLDDLLSFLQANWEQREAFYDDECPKTSQQFLKFEGQKGIRTQNYVGTIVFKKQQLNIFPKVFKECKGDDDTSNLSLDHLMMNLVNWIEYCTKVEYPYINIKTQIDEYESLKDLFITLFVKYLEAAFERSPYYQYNEKKEDCSSIKGRFDSIDFYARKYSKGCIDKFSCDFSEFEYDNLLNQIIKYVCEILYKDTNAKNQKELQMVLAKLSDVSDFHHTARDCDRIHLSKMNNHYRLVLSMCKIFLLNKTTSFSIDDQDSFCFLFPTEILFEGFIGGYINSLLGDESRVVLQASGKSIFDDVYYGGKSLGKAFTMVHDVLIESPKYGVFVLDTKYKELSRFEGNDSVKEELTSEITSGDLYQVLVYALSRNAKKTYLIYPLFRYEKNEPDFPVFKKKIKFDDKEVLVDVCVLRVPFVFENDVEKTKQSLTNVLWKIIES